jgi:hypothetical protein
MKWASSQEARNGQQSGRSSLLAMNKNVPIPYCPFYRPFNYQNSAHGIKRFTGTSSIQHRKRNGRKEYGLAQYLG